MGERKLQDSRKGGELGNPALHELQGKLPFHLYVQVEYFKIYNVLPRKHMPEQGISSTGPFFSVTW